MSREEETLSYYFLFGVSSFIVDPKPLTSQLKKDNPKNRSFSLHDYDMLIGEKLKQTGLFDGIMDKASELDTRQGMENLFEKINDDFLMRQLLGEMVRPEVVYRFKEDRVKRLKRSLQRPEIAFM